MHHDIDIFIEIMEKNNYKPNIDEILHYAIAYKNIKLLKFIIQYPLDIQLRNPFNREFLNILDENDLHRKYVISLLNKY